MQDEPVRFIPFGELIQDKARYSVPLILAVVTTEYTDPNTNITTISHSYYEATGLNKFLFGQILHNMATKKAKYSFNRRLHEPDAFRDPFTKQRIQSINYFTIDPEGHEMTHIGSDVDLFPVEAQQSVLTLTNLFLLHTQIDTLISELPNDPTKLPLLFQFLNLLGDLYAHEQKTELQAMPYYTLVAQQNVNLAQKAHALGQLGLLYSNLKQPLKAIPYLEQAIQQNDNFFEKVRSLFMLGKLYYEQKDYQKATLYLQQAAAQNTYLVTKAKALLNLGELYFDQKEYPKATLYFEQATAQNNSRNVRAVAFIRLGQIYVAKQEHTQALVYLGKVEPQVLTQDLLSLLLNTIITIAQNESVPLNTKIKAREQIEYLYSSLNQSELAIPYLEETAQQSINLGAKLSALYDLGFIYRHNLNQPLKAIAYFEQLANQHINKNRQLEGIRNLGEIYLDLHEYEKAIPYFKQFLAQSLQASSFLKHRTLFALGLSYRALGQVDQARHYFNLILQQQNAFFGEEAQAELDKLEAAQAQLPPVQAAQPHEQGTKRERPDSDSDSAESEARKDLLLKKERAEVGTDL
ncbi:MAG: tetratricopeptide repeat protein [Candidatus Babeliales bacterium]